MPTLSTPKTLLLIFLATTLIYLPFINSSLFWDDEQFIYSNQHVKQFALKEIFSESTTSGAGEPSNYYRPLTTLSFAVDHLLWGLNPIGYHLTNLLLHAGAGMMLYLVLKQLKIIQKPALLITLLFIIHPIQTETVSYANSRGDSLFTLYGLMGLWCLLKLLKTQQQNTKEFSLKMGSVVMQLSSNSLVLGAIGFYVLSILSKEIGLAVMGLYFLSVIYWWMSCFRDQSSQALLTNKLSIFFKKYSHPTLTLAATVLIASGYLWLRSGPLKFQESINPYPPGHPYGDSLLVRLSTFFKVIFIYLRLLIAPLQLHMERTTALVLSPFSIWTFGVIALTLTTTFLGYREYKRCHQPLIWFGSFWFLVMLIPVSGIVPINDILYEHWLYLPSVGFWMVMYGLIRLIMKPERLVISFFKYPITITMLIFVVLSWRQNYLWSDPIRFYLYTLQFNQTPRVHNNLAMAYADRNQHQLALEQYQKAIELEAGYPQVHNNLANIYAHLGEWEKAKASYQKALEINPSLVQSHLGLIRVFVETEEVKLALNQVQLMKDLGLSEDDAKRLIIEINAALD